MTELEDKVRAEVEKIIDPETRMTFGEMRLVTGLKETKPGVVEISFVPSSPFCPLAFKLAMDVRRTAENIKGVNKAIVHCTGHMMEEAINKMVNREESGG